MGNYKAGDPMKDGQLWTNFVRPVIAQKIYEKVNLHVSDHCVKILIKKHRIPWTGRIPNSGDTLLYLEFRGHLT